jgi:fumarate hydratase subunit beta
MEYHLNTPLEAEDVAKLNAGDIVYISGVVLTARDEAHARILEMAGKGEDLPFELEGSVIYHCGPLMKKDDGKWSAVAAGPTTSGRMSKMTPSLLGKHKVRALIGKGGMQNVTDSLQGKCVYLAYTGGCAALAVQSIKKVLDVHWLDLGMPEAVWELEVEEFGPLTVGIDSNRNDLFRNVNERAKDMFSRL